MYNDDINNLGIRNQSYSILFSNKMGSRQDGTTLSFSSSYFNRKFYPKTPLLSNFKDH